MPSVSLRHARLGSAVLVAALPFVLSSCPADPNLPGHSTITSLQDAMREDFMRMREGNAAPPFVYYLCPGVTYRPQVEGAWIEPLADQTFIKCGEDGSSEDACVVEGGDLQVALVESEMDGYVRKRTTFEGITFSGSKGWSVAAYDTSDTTVKFSDCHWKGISGQVGIQIVYKERPNSSNENPTLTDDGTVAQGRTGLFMNSHGRRQLQESYIFQKGMNVVIEDSSFSESWGLTDQFFFGVSNAEGTLKMENVKFFDNKRNNTGTSIAVWNQGSAQIESCSFHDNEFDVIVYNYQGEATIKMSTFTDNTGQSSIGVTGGYTGISGNRFVDNVYQGSGNIEAKSGYVDVSYCEFLGTSAQSDIIMYGQGGSLFLGFSCFIDGDYMLSPVFIGSDAKLEESTYIYSEGLKPRSGQECVDPPGAFLQTGLFESNYTSCFDDDLGTSCVGTCTPEPFDALSCDFQTPLTEAPTAAPADPVEKQSARTSSSYDYLIPQKALAGNFGASIFLFGWMMLR